MNELEVAKKMRDIYLPTCEFPQWVIDDKLWETFNFKDTRLFYNIDDSIDDVKLMVTEREPCNLAFKRYYNEPKLKKEFGWEHGAYRLSTPEKLMPNIAMYCNATVKTKEDFINVHVINLVGFAFDSPDQPDYKYFIDKPLTELIQHYSKMWQYAFHAAKRLRLENKINKIKIYNVGGGAFAGPLKNFITDIFEPSFIPLVDLFYKYEIQIDGYDFETKQFNGGLIPDILDDPEEDYRTTLYVNAWDPWSLIGNGNNRDRSLDGSWGRCSNMSVLGWYLTNPHMKLIGI
jgi:hypothetical protein